MSDDREESISGRLRDIANKIVVKLNPSKDPYWDGDVWLLRKAADEITRLTAELEAEKKRRVEAESRGIKFGCWLCPNCGKATSSGQKCYPCLLAENAVLVGAVKKGLHWLDEYMKLMPDIGADVAMAEMEQALAQLNKARGL